MRGLRQPLARSKGKTMRFRNIESLPGSPQPADIFEPHMPGVDLLSDMDGFFVQVRELLEAKNIYEHTQSAGLSLLDHPDKSGKETPQGLRHVAVITPGRIISLAPAPLSNTISEKELASLESLLPSETPLQITSISYTKLEAYVKDTTKTKCIPFLGYLLAFASLGHNVVVFEGHPSALASGVRNSDVLIIDSGMLPFMSEDWADAVFQAMKPNPKVFIHERKNYELTPIVRKSSPPGWRYSEPDGEASYTNMLLTAMSKPGDKTQIANIISGQPLPNPKEFTTDKDQLEYISTLPFRYEKLNADMVIKILWGHGRPANLHDLFQSTRTLKGKFADSDHKLRDISFQLKLSKTSDGKKQLAVRLL
jgi:hypothetical protein